ncbi:DnaJ domain-containing protein [candidate division KSB1 bacterium]|nr:DnaJ domain-containing protein [candidate division KSB1 bacterium]
MRFKDYYKTLEIDERASREEIKKSFRRLAKKYHPDANPGNKTAEECFKEINEAYNVIGDESKRAKYDQLRFYGRPDANNNGWYSFDPDFLKNHGWPGTAGAGQQGPFGQFFGQGFAFSDILRDLFGLNGMHAGFDMQPEAPRNITGNLKISFMEAIMGTERVISVRQKKNCPGCHGTGQNRQALCMRCHGRGAISTKKKIRIKLPAGIENGHQLRLRGLGSESTGLNARASDVIITVQVESHPYFRRTGVDIYCEARVEDTNLQNGTRLRVPTLQGKQVELNIPAGTKKGTLFRLKNYGLKSAAKQGDQFVKIV